MKMLFILKLSGKNVGHKLFYLILNMLETNIESIHEITKRNYVKILARVRTMHVYIFSFLPFC